VKPEFKPVQEAPFLIEEGRFFHTMLYLPFPGTPENLLGGNVTALLWRLNDEPDSWRMTYRFRRYNSADPNDKRDHWSWYIIHVGAGASGGPSLGFGDPGAILNRFKQVIHYALRTCFRGAPDLAECEFEELTIMGDNEHFLKILHTNRPHWMSREEPMPAKHGH